MGLSDPARMESEDLPLTHATCRSTGSEDRHGLGWWVLGCLLPSCPLMSSVLSQGPRSQLCSASTASSLTQQATFPVLLSWEQGRCVLTQPVDFLHWEGPSCEPHQL